MLFTWWQFSDLHWPSAPPAERVLYAKRLLEGLAEQILPEYGNPDAVVMTGDVAYSGRSAEYESAEKHFFNPLATMLAAASPPFFAVPGNHDFNREQADNLNADRITSIRSLAELDAFLADERAMETYLTPFADFRDFARRRLSPTSDDMLSWTAPVNVAGHQVQFTGLNSAWSGYYPVKAGGESDERHLMIGLSQLHQAAADSPAFRFLLMHHPFDWLNRELCSRVEQEARETYNLVLFGHVHSARDLGLIDTLRSRCLLVPSALLYHEPYDDSIEFARGFVVGQLDLTTARCEVRYFRYSDAFGPKFMPYTDLYPTGLDRFSVSLTPDGDPVATQSSILDPLQSSFHELVSRATITETLRSQVGVLANAPPELERPLGLFAEMVETLAAHIMIVPREQLEIACFAYVTGEIAIAEAIRSKSAPIGTRFVSEATIAEMRRLRDTLPNMGTDDFDSLVAIVESVTVGGSTDFRRFGSLGDRPGSLMFALLWGMAQYVLVIDCPGRWDPASLDGAPTTLPAEENILSVAPSDGGSTCVVHVSTKTRAEFHQMAEGRFLVERYVSDAEDAWRNAGLIAPPMSLRVEYPFWNRRTLESQQFRVDPKPIARLLMGRALYGDKRHVWLRELLLNALDATEMRVRTLAEASYEARVAVRLISPSQIIVEDNGIGMSYQHVVSYLATLGRSGWRTSTETESATGEGFFGRFGIGFASVFSEAQSVEVLTRQPATRSVDGISVQFSDPERPFFVEPSTCSEGTSITIHLKEEMTPEAFGLAMRELFVYLPASVVVEPAAGLPDSLEGASILGDLPTRPPSVVSVVNTKLGTFSARVRVELLAPMPSQKRGGRGSTTNQGGLDANTPMTQLTAAIAGVRVFNQAGLRLVETGIATLERAWRQMNERSLGLTHCYATIDFERENAPILPSRDSLEVSEQVANDAQRALERGVTDLFPRLVAMFATNDPGRSAQRSAFLRGLGTIVASYGWRWDRAPLHSLPDGIVQGLVEQYGNSCPILVRSRSAEETLHLVKDIDPSSCHTAILEKLAESSAFAAYARSSKLTTWVVVRNHLERTLLARAWPFEQALRGFSSLSQVFHQYREILPETRSLKVVQILRGDYALSDSPVFGNALFVHLPYDVQPVPRHVGASNRRSEVDSTRAPRVVMNSRHPLVKGIETYLTRVDDEQRQPITTWLDSFCDGVIEDKSKMAPRARWSRLAKEFTTLTGIEVRTINVEEMRLTTEDD